MHNFALSLFIAVVHFSALFPDYSHAATTNDATIIVEKTIKSIDFLLTANISGEALYQGIEKIFEQHAASKTVAKVALGRFWNKLSIEEQEKFHKVFVRYLSEKYSHYFPKFIGGDYIIKYSRTTRNEQTFEVVTTMYTPTRAPFPVYWHLVTISENPLIYNIIVDDLNLLLLERTVIQSLLSQSGYRIKELLPTLAKRYLE